MVNKEIQSIWLKFKFNQVLNTSANHDSYKMKAKELINAILSNEILYLDGKTTCISVNLDAAQIRQVCTDHGIEFVPTQESQGGFVLKDVKDRRNSLAHGVISFTKCGRDYTIDGLEKIKTETAFY